MMPNLYLFFSHSLTEDQEKEVYEKLKCEKILPLKEELQKLWGQIPPEGEISDTMVEPFMKYLSKETKPGDFVLIQGEFGVSFALVNWCIQNDRIPIYATTKRLSLEEKQPDGSIKKINIFKHIQFRRYVII
ncbi:MAG: hypothetical protein K9N07_10155 [Candidatus Cloacimonetes bacterium]|nr:hypothetical protein [Candidatus Cloacimonadota bacterium]